MAANGREKESCFSLNFYHFNFSKSPNPFPEECTNPLIPLPICGVAQRIYKIRNINPVLIELSF